MDKPSLLSPASTFKGDRLRPSSSLLKARSARVIFSPHQQLHPYSPHLRPASRAGTQRSSHPDLTPAAGAGAGTPTKGILKRTNSDDIRLAKDTGEGTRINTRQERRTTGSSHVPASSDDVRPPMSDRPPVPSSSSSVLSRTSDHQRSSSPSPSRSPPSSSPPDPSPLSLVDSTLSCIRTVLASSSNVSAPSHTLLHSLQDLTDTYTSLTAHFRTGVVADASHPDADALLRPLRENAPALVRSFTRDFGRLFETPSSIARQREVDSNSPPSSSDGESSGSDEDGSAAKRRRRGYSEEEITQRREGVLVAPALLKWLALVFHSERIWSCFEDADVLHLLRLLLQIPLRTNAGIAVPPFTAPNKKTYSLAIYALTHHRLPARILAPVANDIVHACKRATELPLKSQPNLGEGNPKAKSEALGALYNAVSRTPSVFLPLQAEVLPLLLKAVVDKTSSVRMRATAALGAAVLGGRSWIAEVEGKLQEALKKERASQGKGPMARAEKERRAIEDEVRRARKCVEDGMGLSVVGHFRKKVGGEKMVSIIVQQLKLALEKDNSHWAISTWAIIVTLLGKNIAPHINELLGFMTMARSDKTSLALTHLCRVAWDHAIHALLSQSCRRLSASDLTVPPADDPMAYDVEWALGAKRTKLLGTLVFTELTRDQPPELLDVVSPEGVLVGRRWAERERGTPGSKIDHLKVAEDSLINLLYGYTGAILCAPLPAQDDAAAARVPTTAVTPAAPLNILAPNTPSSGLEVPPATALTSDFDSLQATLTHLSTLYDAILSPALTAFLSLPAADDIKVKAWSLLLALSRSSSDLGAEAARSSWKIDRLLCSFLLGGHISSADISTGAPTRPEREAALGALALAADKEMVRADDLVPWPAEWLVARFSSGVVKMFEKAWLGVKGVVDETCAEWVCAEGSEGVEVLPVVLSQVWRNILVALKTAQPPENEPSSPQYALGMCEVTRFVGQVLKADPLSYVPPCLERACDLSLVRFGLVDHLFSVALEVLGPGALSSSLPLPDIDIMGAGRSGANGTTAGFLITCLLSQKLPTASEDPASQSAFLRLLDKLVDVGTQGPGLRLLGDLTMVLDQLAPGSDEEALQMRLWSLVGKKWTSIWPKSASDSVEEPEEETLGDPKGKILAPPGESTTITLLINHLTDPFRRFPNTWAKASPSDLAIWTDLLETTVERAKVKRMDPNIFVAENLTATLQDFEVLDTLSQATLACLSSLALSIRYPSAQAPSSDSDTSFKSRMRSLPDDALLLLRQGLERAHTVGPDLPAAGVQTLLSSIDRLLKELPVGFLGKAIEILGPAVGLWANDDKGMLADEHIALYETVLSLLATTSQTKEGQLYRVLPATSASLDRLVPLIQVLRFPTGHRDRLLLALETFWRATFDGTLGLVYPESVKDVLKGLRRCKVDADLTGLSISQDPTLEFPDPLTQTYAAPESQLEVLQRSQDALESDYDADVSASFSKGPSGGKEPPTQDLVMYESHTSAIPPPPLATQVQPATSSAVRASSPMKADDGDEDEYVEASLDVDELPRRPRSTRSQRVSKEPSPAASVESLPASASSSTASRKRRRSTSASLTRAVKPRHLNELNSLLQEDLPDTVPDSDAEDLIICERAPPSSPEPGPAPSRLRKANSQIVELTTPGGLTSTASNRTMTRGAAALRKTQSSSVLATAVSWLGGVWRAGGDADESVPETPDAALAGATEGAKRRRGRSSTVEIKAGPSPSPKKVASAAEEEEERDDEPALSLDVDEMPLKRKSPRSTAPATPDKRDSPSTASARKSTRHADREKAFGSKSLINRGLALPVPTSTRKRPASRAGTGSPAGGSPTTRAARPERALSYAAPEVIVLVENDAEEEVQEEDADTTDPDVSMLASPLADRSAPLFTTPNLTSCSPAKPSPAESASVPAALPLSAILAVPTSDAAAQLAVMNPAERWSLSQKLVELLAAVNEAQRPSREPQQP